MKYLLDSHILIWALFDDEKLPHEAYDLINDPQNEIYYSVASIWEITIKHDKAPLKMPVSGRDLAFRGNQADMVELPILKQHAFELPGLRLRPESPPHNDPFDRILISQAKSEGMILITHDHLLAFYDEPCVLLV